MELFNVRNVLLMIQAIYLHTSLFLFHSLS